MIRLLWSVHVHMVPALYRILTGSFTRLIFYGLSLLRNALQNELTTNGTRAVLSARAHLLDVIFGDCDKHSSCRLTVYPANGYGKPAVLTL